MRQHTQRSTTAILRTLALTALLAALAISSSSPANAQQVSQQGDIDLDAVVERVEHYLASLVAVDLDADGFADFDSSADGIAEIQVERIDDLAIRPGESAFVELLRNALGSYTSPSPAASIAGDCSSILLSFDGQGNLIDSALTIGSGHGGGDAGIAMDLFPQHDTGAAVFTQENPFVVGDRVVVIGQAGPDAEAEAEAEAYSWQLSSAELVLAQGLGVDDNAVAAEIVVADYAPIAGLALPVGLFPVDLDVGGTVTCQSDGWVHFDQGSPLLTNVGIAASGLSVIGALGLFCTARPTRAWKKEDEA